VVARFLAIDLQIACRNGVSGGMYSGGVWRIID
jgi:hypothetical protein